MSSILTRVFPRQLDNTFPGQKIALWVFVLLTGVTLWRSQHHILAPDGGAQSIATIPLDTFSSEGSETIIAMFALWGLSQLILAVIYVVALIRYRSLIPLLYLLMALEYFGRFAIGQFKEVVTAGTAPGAIANIPWMVIALAMFALSVWPRKAT